jgi:hypothetical protein
MIIAAMFAIGPPPIVPIVLNNFLTTWCRLMLVLYCCAFEIKCLLT